MKNLFKKLLVSIIMLIGLCSCGETTKDRTYQITEYYFLDDFKYYRMILKSNGIAEEHKLNKNDTEEFYSNVATYTEDTLEVLVFLNDGTLKYDLKKGVDGKRLFLVSEDQTVSRTYTLM